jgi:hypothetical protein
MSDPMSKPDEVSGRNDVEGSVMPDLLVFGFVMMRS